MLFYLNEEEDQKKEGDPSNFLTFAVKMNSLVRAFQGIPGSTFNPASQNINKRLIIFVIAKRGQHA